jgi:hypothetical protein
VRHAVLVGRFSMRFKVEFDPVGLDADEVRIVTAVLDGNERMLRLARGLTGDERDLMEDVRKIVSAEFPHVEFHVITTEEDDRADKVG